jgi:hypothetical protein
LQRRFPDAAQQLGLSETQTSGAVEFASVELFASVEFELVFAGTGVVVVVVVP